MGGLVIRFPPLPLNIFSGAPMRAHLVLSVGGVVILPAISSAQASPAADAFRNEAKRAEKNLVAAAEVMPADKYSFKPTPAQMSFGDIVEHLRGGNDILCAPT